MSPKDHECTHQQGLAVREPGHSPAKPGTRWRECVPCDIPPFCRNHYFTGKLLTEQDFTAEQQYFRDKFRLHHRALHGWGVVCGLRVRPHPFCPDLRVVVEPGLAIDCCGYEIVVPRAVEIELPRRPGAPPSQTDPCPPDMPRKDQDPSQQPEPYGRPRGEYGEPQRGYGEPQRDHGEAPPGHGETPRGYGEPQRDYGEVPRGYGEPERDYGGAQRGYGQPPGGYGEGRPEPGPKEPCAPRGPEIPLSVCLRYAECETGFMPAPFDECGCNGSQGQQPNRICESFVLELRQEQPPRVDTRVEGDCLELFHEALKSCPRPTHATCLPLAFIANYAPGDTVTEAMIDNRSYRPLLPSTRVHDELLRCILTRLPVQSLTRVRDIGWTQGQEFPFHDFVTFFTGNAASGPGFEVIFDAPVRSEGLSPRSFQALVVRHQGPRAGLLELPPSIVWPSPDRTRFYLQINRAYAERELQGVQFDVYITLRCNLILDQHGRAVDGDLVARLEEGSYVVAPPTGNGMPGGSLESWIRVRSR